MANESKIKKVLKTTSIVVFSLLSFGVFTKIALGCLISGGDFLQYKHIGDTKVVLIDVDATPAPGAKDFAHDEGGKSFPSITKRAFFPYLIFYDTHFIVAHGSDGWDYKPYYVIIELPENKVDIKYTDYKVEEFYSSDLYNQAIKEKNIQLDKMNQTDAHIPWRIGLW